MRIPLPLASRHALVLAVVLAILPALATANMDPAITRKQQVPPPRYTGDLLIQFRSGAPAAVRDSILADLGITNVSPLPRIGAARARPARVSVDEAIRRYKDHPDVAFIEPDVFVRTLAIPNDPNFRPMWQLRNLGQTDGVPGADINVTPAWDQTTGSTSVLVAITDTGVDWRHPDLAPNLWTNPGEIPNNGLDDDGNGFVDDVRGWDFANDDGNPMDDMGHGTHVAGTIGAVGNNAIGVVGVNWRVRLLPVKFLNANGEGPLSDGIRAIDYAVRMGARVINASWGDHVASEALRQAIERAGEAGVLLVAASGNDGVNNDGGDIYGPPNYPASYDLPNIISVGAFNYRRGMMWWSNYGAKSVDLCAPGVAILSTIPHGEYGPNTGTSMAAPHVAGVAALVLAQHPRADALEVKDLILSSVVPVPEWQGLTVTGGRLDAGNALANRDSLAPAPVGDLAGAGANGTRVMLRWTATGDDGMAGQARRYDLRMSKAPIDAANFAVATRIAAIPAPQPQGGGESFEVRGLEWATTYFFALVVRDECGNASALSNVAPVTTLARPEIDVSLGPLAVDLLTNQTATRSLAIHNRGPSEMRVHLTSPQTWISVPARDTVIPAGGRFGAAITVSASRLGTGNYSGSIDVSSDDADQPRITIPVSMRVTGVPDVGVNVDRLTFGDVLTGQARDLAVTVRNDGSRPLAVDSIGVGQAVFTLSATRLLIDPFAYKVVTVRFAPNTTAPHADTLRLMCDDPDQPVVALPMSGRGIPAPHAVVAPLAFADTLASWGTVTRTLTLWNPHGSDLVFQVGHSGGAWLSLAPGGGRIAPGDSAQVLVTMRAIDLPESMYSATLNVETNDPDVPKMPLPVVFTVYAAPDLVLSQPPRTVESAQDWFATSTITLHDLVIPGPTVGDARVELEQVGGYGGPAGLQLEDVYVGSTEPGAPCTLRRAEFRFPAADFERVAADGIVQARIGSSELPNHQCLIDQHRIRLTWTPALDVLDFGTVWVGGNEARTLMIRNRGLRALHVDPPAGQGPFTVGETTGLTLAPGDTGTFTVRYRPVAAGAARATLTLASDDPDRRIIEVPMKGEGAIAPNALLSAVQIEQRLPSGGHGTQPLVITNHGGSELVFDVAIESDHVAAAPLSSEGAWVLLVEDVDPWDYWSSGVNQHVLESAAIRFTTLSSAALADADLSLFTKIIISGDQKTATYRNVQAAMPKLADFVYQGGTLEFHTGFGWSDGDASLITLPRGVGVREVWGWINVIRDPTHPLVAGVNNPVIAWGRQVNVSLAAFTHVPDDAEQLVLDDSDNPTLVLYRHGAGTVIATGQVLELGWYRSWDQRPLMENLIRYRAAPSRDWLTTGTWSGRIPPGGSATMGFELGRNDLAPGDHVASIVLRTNDPARPRITVPVRLTVQTAPDIVVEGPAVTLDSFQPFQGDGARTVHTFTVPASPAGNGTLALTAIGDIGERDEFATMRLEGSVIGQARVAGAEGDIPVTFAQLQRATADGRIEVEVRNERTVGTTAFPINEHRVRLTYPTGTNPIAFGTSFLGQCSERRIQIANRGASELHLAAPVVSNVAFRVEPATGLTLAPGESRSLVVSFCPLTAGAIDAICTLRSDDPDQSEVMVSVRGEGVPPPDVALAPAGVMVALMRGETASRALKLANDGGSPLDYGIEIESGSRSGTSVRTPAATPVSADQWARIRDRYQAFRSTHAAGVPHRGLTPPTFAPARADVAPAETARSNSSSSSPRNETEIFFDDMEHGESGWTHSPTSSGGVDSWTLSSVRVVGGRRSWQVIPHETEGSDALTSPAIDLSGHAQATLTFATWYSFDDCIATPGYEPDGGLVEVSVEGSGTWTPAAPVDGYPFVLDDTCFDPLGGRPGYAHHSAAGDSFVTERFDLSAFAGQRIRIRFHAGWDCGNCDVPDGWFIDDVRVFTDAPKWVSAEPARGRVAPGVTIQSVVEFTPTAQTPATNHATLRVVSNDPEDPVATVPLELVVADLAATLDLASGTVNLGRRGKWLTVALELPGGLDPEAIVVPSLRLNHVVAADPASASVGDHDHDGIADLTVRFALDDLRPTLDAMATRRAPSPPGQGDDVPLVLTGSVRDGRVLLGRATVRVVRPRLALAGGSVLAPASVNRITWTMPADWGAARTTLSFSRNRGIRWQPLVERLAESGWDWTVPDVPSSNALLRAEFQDDDGTLATVVLEPFAIGTPDLSSDPGAIRVERLALGCAPNPFAGGADITLALPARGPVELSAFSVTGQRVSTLVTGIQEAGIQRVRWEAHDARGGRLPAGIYFLRLETPGGTTTRRVVLLR